MIFRRFPKFFKNVSKARRTFPNIFPRVSENFRRCTKIAEDRRCFDDTPTNLSTIQETNLISVKSSISSHVRISYRFYQFVITWYTTDFYIVKGFILYFCSQECLWLLIDDRMMLSKMLEGM